MVREPYLFLPMLTYVNMLIIHDNSKKHVFRLPDHFDVASSWEDHEHWCKPMSPQDKETDKNLLLFINFIKVDT